MAKELKFSEDARAAMLRGVDKFIWLTIDHK